MLLVCAAPATAGAGSAYMVTGASIIAPSAPGWTLVQADVNSVRFENAAASAVEVAEVRAVPTPAFDTADAFLAYAEQWKSADFERWKMVSVHFNYRDSFKNVPCVEYDGIFSDAPTAASKALIRTFGYLCRQPDLTGTAIDISFARTAVEDTMPKASVAIGYAFFDTLTFKPTTQ